MLSKRPLLYLSLPSLALLIGLVWFRRKKSILNCDTGGDKKARTSGGQTTTANGHHSGSDLNRSRSSAVNINCSEGSDEEPLNNSNSSGNSTSSSKSAPIDIQPNSRSPPIPIKNGNNKGGGNLDLNELNSKIRDSEYRTLDSIDESDIESLSISPVDLPGSYERRNFEFVKNNSFYKRNKKMAEEPVIITATKSPKISPKNAFSEVGNSSSSEVVSAVDNGAEVVIVAATKSGDKRTTTASDLVREIIGESKKKSVTMNGTAPDKKPQSFSSSNKTSTNHLDNNSSSSTNSRNCNGNVNDKMAKLKLEEEEMKTMTNGQGEKSQLANIVNNNQTRNEITSTTDSINEVKADDNNNNNNKSLASAAEKSDEESSVVVTNAPISSPPLSLYSVHSSDSGKGSSPPQSEAALLPATGSCYEFLIHEKYVGLMIGRNGAYVKRLNRKFGVKFSVIKHQKNRPNERICAIEGSHTGIEAALDFIRQKMIGEQLPGAISLDRVHYLGAPTSNYKAPAHKKSSNPLLKYPSSKVPISLGLVEGINNDVVISAILNGGHVFLQQPSHPTYQQLNYVQTQMYDSYSTDQSPLLPDPQENSICVAPIQGNWYRVVIISHDVQTKACLVKFLDYGGFTTVLSTDLRQIRADFLVLPFQSIECVLSNLKPTGDDWSVEAASLLFSLTNGLVLQAQVAGYTADKVPEVFLYASLGPDNVVFINQELVAQGYAEWVEEDEEEEEALDEHSAIVNGGGAEMLTVGQ